MTQADSVHSTPPTNTSPTRRNILSTIAAGTVATLASTIAEPATLPTDPIYAAIERHKAAGAIWDAAVDMRANFPDLDISDEQAKQLNLLDEAVNACVYRKPNPDVVMMKSAEYRL